MLSDELKIPRREIPRTAPCAPQRGTRGELLIRLIAPPKLVLNGLADEARDATVAH